MKTTRIWDFLKRNWDTVLTMAIAAPIAILSYFQVVEPQIVSTAVLSVLFLIACGLLVNRETNNRLQQTVEKVWERIQKPTLEEVLIPYKEWMQDIEASLNSAHEVWVLSRTCIRFWEDYDEQLKSVLDRGGSIRLLLVDPRNGAMKMIANSMELAHSRDLTGPYSRVSLENASNRLAQLRTQVDDFVNDIMNISVSIGKERLELRTIEHLPAHTLIVIDGSSEKAIMFVELGTFRSNRLTRPTFSLLRTRDQYLFKLYYEEYQTMWKTSFTMEDLVAAKNNQI